MQHLLPAAMVTLPSPADIAHAHLYVWLHSLDQSIADEYVCLELLVMIDNHATLRIIRRGHGEVGGVWQQLMSGGEGFWGRLAACVHRGSTAALAVQESLSGVQWLAWLGRKAVHMQRPVCQHGQHECMDCASGSPEELPESFSCARVNAAAAASQRREVAIIILLTLISSLSAQAMWVRTASASAAAALHHRPARRMLGAAGSRLCL